MINTVRIVLKDGQIYHQKIEGKVATETPLKFAVGKNSIRLGCTIISREAFDFIAQKIYRADLTMKVFQKGITADDDFSTYDET